MAGGFYKVETRVEELSGGSVFVTVDYSGAVVVRAGGCAPFLEMHVENLRRIYEAAARAYEQIEKED